MGYDLFFKTKSNNFSKLEFEKYFKARKNYTLDNNQAWYENNKTGVYFAFEFNEDDSNEYSDEHYQCSFNINYFRPSFFALEAEPELSNFVNNFGMTINDPQIDGMKNGVYSSSGFLTGWNKGNEFGYESIINQAGEVYTLPTAKLEESWKWNYEKDALQNSVSEDVFVPKIIFVKLSKKVVTACVWPDAVPSILPEVDILLIQRKKLAIRKIFTKKEDVAIGSWIEFIPLISKYSKKTINNSSYVFYDEVPIDIVKAVKNLPSTSIEELEVISPENILNEELVCKCIY